MAAKELIIRAFSKFVKVVTNFHENTGSEDEDKISPKSDLKPFKLELDASQSNFREWLVRLRDFFEGSNLMRASPRIQQAYLRQCLSCQLSDLLHFSFTEDLLVFSKNDEPSCISFIESEMKN